jgi:hypothetical protein
MTDYVMAVLVGLTIGFGAILVSIVCDKLTIWRRAYHRERQFLAWREHEIARKEAIHNARIRAQTPELAGLFGAKEDAIHGTDEEIVEKLIGGEG